MNRSQIATSYDVKIDEHMAKKDEITINEVHLQSTEEIEDLIIEVRGKQTMLDRDLAQLYGVDTKRLNEQVRRNIERFPERFRFQLTDYNPSSE